MAHTHRGNALRRLSIGLMAAITGGSALLLRAEKQAKAKLKASAKEVVASEDGALKEAKIILQDDQGKTVLTNVIRGKAGQTVPVHLQLPTDWEVASTEVIPDTYTFHETGNNDLLIEVRHLLTTGTENKTVHRIIKIVCPDGSEDEKVQAATFTRNLLTNHAHERTSYGEWQPAKQDLPSFTAPKIAGYHADKKVTALTVSAEHPDIHVTVTYEQD